MTTMEKTRNPKMSWSLESITAIGMQPASAGRISSPAAMEVPRSVPCFDTIQGLRASTLRSLLGAKRISAGGQMSEGGSPKLVR